MTNATIEPWLREILRCPVTHSELEDRTDAEGNPVLVCVTPNDDGSRCCYRVEDGIPVLLAEESTRWTQD